MCKICFEINMVIIVNLRFLISASKIDSMCKICFEINMVIIVNLSENSHIRQWIWNNLDDKI